MTEPIFWLACSFFLVAVSLTAVLIAALPALQELSRAARSAEKLFDTLHREFPPTLEAIRLTGAEIVQLTEEIDEGVKSAAGVAKQVDKSLTGTKDSIGQVGRGTRRVLTGFRAAWETWNRPTSGVRSQESGVRRYE